FKVFGGLEQVELFFLLFAAYTAAPRAHMVYPGQRVERGAPPFGAERCEVKITVSVDLPVFNFGGNIPGHQVLEHGVEFLGLEISLISGIPTVGACMYEI